jgi:hypothetical protein
VGRGNVIKLAFENDVKIVIPLLMVCLEWLNPSIVAIVITNDDVKLELEENILEWGPLVICLGGCLFPHLYV